MPEIRILPAENRTCELQFSGKYVMGEKHPSPEAFIGSLSPDLKRIRFCTEQLEAWDSTLLPLLTRLQDHGGEHGIDVDTSGLPEGVQRLLHLAGAVPERPGTRKTVQKTTFTEKVGLATLEIREESVSMLRFVGQITSGFFRLLRGRARFRLSDLLVHMEDCGPGSLGIITVISLLVGAILAFVGAVQLSMFGAEVFVANLVGLGMVMEMGALMTGIILSGRTGAAFAAQLGTMQVNEEIDALQTMGIPPVDYLVLPRMLALILLSPLLIIYANTLGIIGGAVVGTLYLDIPPEIFFRRTFEYVTPWLMAQGLIKGTTFGLLVAFSGCLRGMQCGRSASGVGRAATRAVVTSLLLIVIADAVWTFLFILMG